MNALLGKCALLLVGLGMALSVNELQAQRYYDGYGGGYHSSTAAEGYQRGMADVVRSQGMKNLMDSEAAINVEEARSANIDNRIKSTNAYWERKRIYEENTAQARYERNQERAKHRSRVTLKELQPNQLDPTTGLIHWPSLLEEDQYDDFRLSLTELFAKRGQYGALSSDDYLQAKQLIKDWRGEVTRNKSQYTDVQLRDSLRFLLKLNRELDSNFG